MKNIYEVCPTYKNDYIRLRQTTLDDTEELLKCYSDQKSVPFFNSDNCNGDDFNHYGVLRIDLKSKYENQKVIDAILEITNQKFYDLFDVKSILTKAVPLAEERVISLKKKGYIKLCKKFMIYDNYMVRTI